jgi:hypothetical protein
MCHEESQSPTRLLPCNTEPDITVIMWFSITENLERQRDSKLKLTPLKPDIIMYIKTSYLN